MRNMLRLIKADLKRAISNRVFWICVIGIALLEIMDVLPVVLSTVTMDGWRIRTSYTIVDLFQIGGGLTLYNLLTITLCVIPFTGCYCDDTSNNMVTSIVTRSSYGKYSASMLTTCGISAFTCAILGEILFTVILLLIAPLSNEASFYNYETWQTLVDGHMWLFVILRILLRGLRGAFFALVTMMVSAFVRDKFFLFSMPTILYYFLMYVVYDLVDKYGLKTAGYFNVWNVYFTFQLGVDKEFQSIAFSFFYTLSVGIICWFVFYRKR
jgi:hypothetical protein